MLRLIEPLGQVARRCSWSRCRTGAGPFVPDLDLVAACWPCNASSSVAVTSSAFIVVHSFQATM